MLPGISTEQLRSRLNRMVADGLLTRQRYREVPPRVDYELTERSRELMPVLGALARWGYDWTWSRPAPGRGRQPRRDLPARARGCSRRRADVRGSVDSWSSADDEDRTFRLIAADGHVEISERPSGPADATVTGSSEAWVERARAGRLDRRRSRSRASAALAEALLAGSPRAAAGRAAQRAA